MRTGVYILCVFAAIWGVFACAGLGLPMLSWIAPAAVSAAVCAYVAPRVYASASLPPAEQRRVGRLVALWTGVEGVAIPIACVLLANTGHVRLTAPAIGLIVGLHFLPLARGLPARIYYLTGSALSLVSLAAMVVPGENTPMIVTGAAGAMILWATCLALPGLAARRTA